MVAPDREVSACAQSLTLKHPLRAEKIEERVYAVDGTPADCVNLALVKLLPRRPDLVVSGINRGAQPGRGRLLLRHRGRRARRRRSSACPSIAISLAARADIDFTPAAALRAQAGRAWCWRRGCPSGRC